MEPRPPRNAEIITVSDISELINEAARVKRAVAANRPDQIPRYRLSLGLEPLTLGNVEFEILFVLAGKPYRPFTRREIVAGVFFSRDDLSEDNVDDYIATLRDQLGPFHDYIQTVPYIGYRFKA
ncbi:MAG: winged helix-turn-helix transcriptional regulator [Planctomycetales bacterium]|nr:winged helix-turn-helix transcriptional regulator [Planctomycetales bacterium]